LNGIWTDERYPGEHLTNIRGDTISWSSGDVTQLKLEGDDSLSTVLKEGHVCRGQIDSSGRLCWDFGSVWIRHVQALPPRTSISPIPSTRTTLSTASSLRVCTPGRAPLTPRVAMSPAPSTRSTLPSSKSGSPPTILARPLVSSRTPQRPNDDVFSWRSSHAPTWGASHVGDARRLPSRWLPASMGFETPAFTASPRLLGVASSRVTVPTASTQILSHFPQNGSFVSRTSVGARRCSRGHASLPIVQCDFSSGMHSGCVFDELSR